MCPSAHSLPGSLGAAQSAHRIVYDASSGDIVSVVDIAAVAGAELPSSAEIDELAIRQAARLASVPSDRLAVVAFDPTTRRPDAIHRVDPVTNAILDRDSS